MAGMGWKDKHMHVILTSLFNKIYGNVCGVTII